MKKYKAVVFDLDGTLIDTIRDLGNSMNRILDNYGYEGWSIDEYRKMVGWGIPALVETAFSRRGGTATTGIISEFTEDYEKHSLDYTVPYPGIISLIENLNLCRIQMGIITNKDENLANKIVASLFKSDYFLFLRGGRKDSPLKPDPSGVLEETEKMNMEQDDIIFLGDSEIDMQTALNAGMFPCGVSWGFRSVDLLLENGAAQIIDSPIDLMKLME